MNKNPKNENLKPFKKGHDERRNLNGAPKKIPALDEVLADVLSEENSKGVTVAKQIVSGMAKEAIKGNVKAANLPFERAYGKVPNDVEQDTEVNITINRNIIRREITIPKKD